MAKGRIVFRFFVVLVVLISAGPRFAQAIELQEFYRGVRAMGMGNAFTAISDDADAVFYNPAGLAFNRRIELHLFNPKFDVSDDDFATATAIKGTGEGLGASSMSKFFGKNIYGGGTVFPSIHVPGFVIGYYYGASLHFVTRNQAMPSIEARYLFDKGVITGFGKEFRGISRKHFVRVGTNLKWLSREGYDGTIPFSKIVTIDSSLLKTLRAGPDSGFGFGLGFQYEIPISRSDDLVFASAWNDIGDTRFGSSNSNNRPPPIRNNLSAGMAFIHHMGHFWGSTCDLKISGEARHLAESDMDPRMRTHIGTELKLGGLSLQGGINQSSLGGGVGVDLSYLKLSVVSYGVDNQTYAFMDRERRYMLQLDFNLDLGGKEYKTNREVDRKKHPRDYR